VNRDDAEEYTQGLGQAVAGSWRLIALGQKLGVPKALGLRTSDWVEQRLGGYVRLSIADRREAVAELTHGDEPLSGRQAADVLGVDHVTVLNDQRARGEKSPPGPGDQDDAGGSGEKSPPLTEAERVAEERQVRLGVWVDKLRKAMETIERMTQGPIPPELADALGDDDVRRLTALIGAYQGAP
jgi:hypothetical protein